jgi:hypothetical protein
MGLNFFYPDWSLFCLDPCFFSYSRPLKTRSLSSQRHLVFEFIIVQKCMAQTTPANSYVIVPLLSESRSNGVAPVAPRLMVLSMNVSCVELGWSAHLTGGGPILHYLLSYRYTCTTYTRLYSCYSTSRMHRLCVL